MNDETEEDLFAQYKKRSERMMRVVIVALAVVMLTVLYFLLFD